MSIKLSCGDSNRSILKFASILSSGTFISRILGFIRDILLASLLGTGIAADAFFVAFKIPNLLRSFVGEGATNAAVVPILSKYWEEKKKAYFWDFVNILFTLSFIVLSLITVLGIFLAPGIVRLMAPGFLLSPEKLLLTTHLTKMMFPYLLFMGLTAYSMAILYNFRSFFVPAFSPCLLNVSLIVSAYIAARTMEEPVFGLAIGVLVGGLLQWAVYIKPLHAVGMRYHWPKQLKHPGVSRVVKLLIPRMVGSGVYQLTVLIDTLCASMSPIVGMGGISAIYYSNRIIQFPLGIFSIALASVLLPTFSRLATKEDYETIKNKITFSIKNIFFVMFPVMVFFFLFSHSIIKLLFQRGAFGQYSTNITSWALSCYSLGLFCFGGIKILVSAFHAMEDTKTPVKIAGVCLLLNAFLNIVLMIPFKIGGIALASAMAGSINFFLLYQSLVKKIGPLNVNFFQFLCRVVISALFTGVVSYFVGRSCSGFNEILRLLLIGIVVVVCYFTSVTVLRVEQAQKIWKWILRK